jgi:membrane protein implicated in regulation of membrane protease activity
MTPTVWFVGALVALIFEFLSGSFYLLVVAVALAGGGVFALLGTEPVYSLLASSLIGLIGLTILTRYRRRLKKRPVDPTINDPDLYQQVTILRLDADGRGRGFYRGAEWDIQLDAANLASVPEHGYIVGRDGNRRILSLQLPQPR